MALIGIIAAVVTIGGMFGGAWLLRKRLRERTALRSLPSHRPSEDSHPYRQAPAEDGERRLERRQAAHYAGHAVLGLLASEHCRLDVLDLDRNYVRQWFTDADLCETKWAMAMTSLAGLAAEMIVIGEHQHPFRYLRDVRRAKAHIGAIVREHGHRRLERLLEGIETIRLEEEIHIDDDADALVYRAVLLCYVAAKRLLLADEVFLRAVVDALLRRRLLDGKDVIALIPN